MNLHIHILGICGTFMGGLALLARELGCKVTGSDVNVYPPMSDQLRDAGIAVAQGYEPAHLQPAPDLVVVGNALSRGNPAIEYMLNADLPYTSGPQWLAEQVLQDRWVLAVAGTHGKTTTSSLLVWMLEQAGLAPGFLIGGVPVNFGASARLGGSRYFVVEADEYDTAFFDKRSKFVHYRPRTLCINNLEFDHGDIFRDIADIQRQFHHLIRCVPGQGRIVVPGTDAAVTETLEMGCWTETVTFSTVPTAGDSPATWQGSCLSRDWARFAVDCPAGRMDLDSPIRGEYNARNILSAMVAADHVGVDSRVAAAAVAGFAGVKRRQELLAKVGNIAVYDDFAHHPTAIAGTLKAFKQSAADARILAVIEPRSNTMRMGQHTGELLAAIADADFAYWYQPGNLGWSLGDIPGIGFVASEIDTLVARVVAEAQPGDQLVIMSNGGFGGIHSLLVDALTEKQNQKPTPAPTPTPTPTPTKEQETP